MFEDFVGRQPRGVEGGSAAGDETGQQRCAEAEEQDGQIDCNDRLSVALAYLRQHGEDEVQEAPAEEAAECAAGYDERKGFGEQLGEDAAT